jgi:hypothetical protein
MDDCCRRDALTSVARFRYATEERHWEYVASPRRGARRLWPWRFDEFLGMVRRAVETALAVRRAVPANKPPDDRFTR